MKWTEIRKQMEAKQYQYSNQYSKQLSNTDHLVCKTIHVIIIEFPKY